MHSDIFLTSIILYSIDVLKDTLQILEEDNIKNSEVIQKLSEFQQLLNARKLDWIELLKCIYFLRAGCKTTDDIVFTTTTELLILCQKKINEV